MPDKIVRFSPVPSSSVNFKSFLLFGTASQASTLTARKSLFEKVSKSTKSLNSGSISTPVKSIFSGSAGASATGAAASVTASEMSFLSCLASPCFLPIGFMVGKLFANLELLGINRYFPYYQAFFQRGKSH